MSYRTGRVNDMDELIKNFLEDFGAVGIAVLMLVENIFPPLPSEVVMPWAGYAVSKGRISAVAAVLAGSVGSFAGALFWYFVGKRIGKDRLLRWVERHGAWLTLTTSDIQRTDDWFDRWGGWAVLFCRMVPGIRTFISVPAGFAEMEPVRFSVCTAIGTVLWTALLTGAGWWLADQHGSLAKPLSWVSWIVIGGLFLSWLWRLVRQQRRVAQS